jgi:hypothetical protein
MGALTNRVLFVTRGRAQDCDLDHTLLVAQYKKPGNIPLRKDKRATPTVVPGLDRGGPEAREIFGLRARRDKVSVRQA